jgi:hypothetical protein
MTRGLERSPIKLTLADLSPLWSFVSLAFVFFVSFVVT